MQLRELGRLPVSNAAPAGTDPRQSAEYQRLLEETAKLSSLRGASAVDWNAVTENAATVLQRQAKDIPAAVYLCVGLAHTGGLPGLARGVRVLADLLDAWWDNSFSFPWWCGIDDESMRIMCEGLIHAVKDLRG